MRAPLGLISLLVCLLATIAEANDRPRTAKGYRAGRPIAVRVVRLDGVDVEVTTARAFRAMRRAAAAAGITLKIESGFRTHQRQTELYRAWRNGYGHRAARPGYSNHQSGRALDLDVDPRSYAWLQANGRAHGFYRTVRGEPWHWEYLGAPRRQVRQARHARQAKPQRAKR